MDGQPNRPEGNVAEFVKPDSNTGQVIFQQFSDKQSSGYDSEHDMDQGTDSHKGSLVSVTSESRAQEVSRITVSQMPSSLRNEQRVQATDVEDVRKDDNVQADSGEMLAVGSYERSSSYLHSPSKCRRFSQVHVCSSKPYTQHRGARSKDDTDLVVHKERSILATSKGRDLKMMETDFHKRRPHLWKHTSDRFLTIGSHKQLSISGISYGTDLSNVDLNRQLSGHSGSSLEMETTRTAERFAERSEKRMPVEQSAEDAYKSWNIKSSIPTVTIDTPDGKTPHKPLFDDTLNNLADGSNLSVKHRSFKKCLQDRYLSSLRDSTEELNTESAGEAREGSVEKEIVDPKNFMEFAPDAHTNVSIAVKVEKSDDDDDDDDDDSDIDDDDAYLIDDGGEVNRDDNEVFVSDAKHQNLAYRLARQRLTALSQDVPINLSNTDVAPDVPVSNRPSFVAQYIEPLPSSDEPSPSAQHSPHLSPSMYYHRNRPVLYSPKHDLLSPRSPLWSVPEGQVFSFSVPNSPFDARPHSDPEFVTSGYSPAFNSPDSPIHFTFPSKVLPADARISPRLTRIKNPTAEQSPSPSKHLTKLFRSPPTAEQLLVSDSSTGERSFACPICRQSFTTYDNVAKHMAKHLPTETIKSVDNSKIHYCRVCERAFSRSDMLTRHMRLHTGLKPYDCRVCGQVFSRSDHLNTHQRTHTGIKPYRCQQCPYSACRRDMITRHMRIHYKRSPTKHRDNDGDDEDDGSYLSIRNVSELQRSPASSVDSFRGQMFSLSSLESFESETGSRTHSVTSVESVEYESHSTHYQRSPADSTELDEGIGGVHLSAARGHPSPHNVQYLDPNVTASQTALSSALVYSERCDNRGDYERNQSEAGVSAAPKQSESGGADAIQDRGST